MRGTRAGEADLLATLETLSSERAGDLPRLARPLRVIVPSRSLVDHLSARLVAQRGRSVAGVLIQTVHGAASEVCARAGEVPREASGVVEVLARREARSEPALSSSLASLDDGYASVAGTVRDLLDAGLEAEAHGEACQECVSETARGAGAERARALLAVAGRVQRGLRAARLASRADLFRRAASLVTEDSGRHLPSEELLLYGFANATGAVVEFLAATMRHPAATIWIDAPRDLVDDAAPAPGRRHFERLHEALTSVPGVRTTEITGSTARPLLRLARAPGARAEVADVARSVRDLLEAGTAPERILVVARDLSRYRSALRRRFEWLGIPFSGVGSPGPLHGGGRALLALRELFARRGETPLDRWLAVLRRPLGAAPVDLLGAFHACGIGRLRDAAAWRAHGVVSVKLRVRRGIELGEPEGVPRHPHRKVASAALEAAAREAGALLERVEALARGRAPLATYLDGWEACAREALGWEPRTPGMVALRELRASAERDVPSDFELDADEALELLARSLDECTRAPLGGAGAGVRVQTVMEARATTAEHLFVLGLNRDVFPRRVREDALLPDALRRALSAVLPDIPVKRDAFDEDRYLFAQLLGAAPDVRLSWLTEDDEARPMALSPLVERLQWSTEHEAPTELPAELAVWDDAPRPAWEHAQLAGIHADRQRVAELLPLALAEVGGGDRGTLADARLAVLEELAPTRQREDLGPYYGQIGPVRSPSDPRVTDPFVTRLERWAGCPWQAFLSHMLRLEPLRDPLRELPSLTPLLIGNAVHEILEGVVRSQAQLPEDAGEAADAGSGARVAWPDARGLAELARSGAARVSEREGWPHPGLTEALARLALPFLARAAALDEWDREPLEVLATEAWGRVPDPRPGGQRSVGFKVDRIDRAGGRLRLTDYKTGGPFATQKREENRHKKMLEAVASGERLQVAAYARAFSGSVGRYLFLKADVDPALAAPEIEAEDSEALEAFARATGRLLDGWEAGAAFPMLVDREKLYAAGKACERCEWDLACMQGDSGYRGRFVRWVEEARDSGAVDHNLRLFDQGDA